MQGCNVEITQAYSMASVKDSLSRVPVRRALITAARAITSAVATEHADHADIVGPDVRPLFTHGRVVLVFTAALFILHPLRLST